MTTTSPVNGPSFLRASGAPNDESVLSDAPLLPEPSAAGIGSDSLAELAALLTQADEQDRTQARTLAQTADNAAMRESNQQVQAMRQKADSDRSAAVWSGVGDIAAGSFTLGSAFVAAPAGSASDRSVDWHAALEAGAKASPGIGTLAAAGFKASAEQDDASAAAALAAAQADGRAYDEAHEDAQSAGDSIQKVTQFLGEIQATQNATLLAVATFRG